MGLQPEDSEPQRVVRLKRWLPAAGLVAGLSVLAWAGADRSLGLAYRQLKPWLEWQTGRAMGQPLELGPYRGLRPWGIAAGASRFKPLPNRPSTIDASEVSVGFDPLLSLWHRAVVLRLNLSGTEVHLRQNREGAYWVLGRVPAGRTPPRLILQIQVQQPAQVRVQPLSAAPLDLLLRGQLQLELHRRQLELAAAAQLPRGGQLRLRLDSQWRQRRWAVQVQPQRLPLQALVPLLPPALQRNVNARLDGLASGQLQIAAAGVNGAAAGQSPRTCQGLVRVQALAWRVPGLGEPLRSPGFDLRCRDQAFQLLRSPLELGSWRGHLGGQFQVGGPRAGQVSVQAQAGESRAGHRLVLQLAGPWRDLAVRLHGQWQPPRSAGRRPDPWPVQATLRLQFPRETAPARRQFRLAALALRVGQSRLQASGSLWPQLRLRTQTLHLGPDLWRAWPASRSLLGAAPQLTGSLSLDGRWGAPTVALQLLQARNPLLGRTSAEITYTPGLLRLQRLQAGSLQATGSLPLVLSSKAGPRWGPLSLSLDLQRFSLAGLGRQLGVPLRGSLDLWGQLQGPVGQLQPRVQLQLVNPGFGPVALMETWRGELRGQSLQLTALAPAPSGSLQASLSPGWRPRLLSLQRAGGQLRLVSTPSQGGYRVTATSFPLQGLALALGPRQRLQPLQGLLTAGADLALSPLKVAVAGRLSRPALLGVRGQQLAATASWHQGRFEVEGQFSAETAARVAIHGRGRRGGDLWWRFEGRRLDAPLLRQLQAAWPLWRGERPLPRGRASDLGSLAIDTLGGSVSDQLQALVLARQRLVPNSPDPLMHPDQLRTLVDADFTVVGDSPQRLFVDLAAKGHLWLSGSDGDTVLTRSNPFSLRLQGPLREGNGQFSAQNLPLALLALLTPVPEGLRGGLALQGRYRVGGRRPELELALALQEARLAQEPLVLERGLVRLQGETLALDWSLRSGGAANSLDLRGQVPLRPEATNLELRIASRGDGLRFLSVLGGPGLQWRGGSADLQLLVRGSLADPLANGFLRFRDGVLQLAGQTLREIEATVLFDFQDLELQQLQARLGSRGTISGAGQLALIRPRSETPRQLRLNFKQAPLAISRLRAQADGQLLVGGSLLRPALGGELRISRGTLNVQPGQLATEAAPTRPVTVRQLVEQQWDFRQPLLVVGAQMEGNTSRDLRDALPNLSNISFRGLRLRLGPDLRMVVPNVLNFGTGGLLTLNGALDPTLRATGVVRLLNGRVGLFTTTFSLDPDSPNVAVFTPSLGLIPYVDIALRTRVSDTLNVGSIDPSSIYNWNPVTNTAGNFSSFDQLRLVRVRLQATGPADRLAENLRLTSSPPLPQDRLIALIGGNSLVGLVSGNAGSALATVLGQTLLTPVVGGLSDALGQRLSFALYPTYFAPAQAVASGNRSGRLPSQLVLGSEIGLDLSERFNFSVLAAPNRSDIPPQVTLRYQASDRLGLQTSVDTQGRWQSQMQLFFRF